MMCLRFCGCGSRRYWATGNKSSLLIVSRTRREIKRLRIKTGIIYPTVALPNQLDGSSIVIRDCRLMFACIEMRELEPGSPGIIQTIQVFSPFLQPDHVYIWRKLVIHVQSISQGSPSGVDSHEFNDEICKGQTFCQLHGGQRRIA